MRLLLYLAGPQNAQGSVDEINLLLIFSRFPSSWVTDTAWIITLRAFVLHRATWLSTHSIRLGPQASLRPLSPLQPEQHLVSSRRQDWSGPLTHLVHSMVEQDDRICLCLQLRMSPSLTGFTALRQFLEMPYGLLFCRNGLCQWHF